MSDDPTPQQGLTPPESPAEPKTITIPRPEEVLAKITDPDLKKFVEAKPERVKYYLESLEDPGVYFRALVAKSTANAKEKVAQTEAKRLTDWLKDLGKTEEELTALAKGQVPPVSAPEMDKVVKDRDSFKALLDAKELEHAALSTRLALKDALLQHKVKGLDAEGLKIYEMLVRERYDAALKQALEDDEEPDSVKILAMTAKEILESQSKRIFTDAEEESSPFAPQPGRPPANPPAPAKGPQFPRSTVI